MSEEGVLRGTCKDAEGFAERAALLAEYLSVTGDRAYALLYRLEQKYGYDTSVATLVKCAVFDIAYQQAKADFAYISTGDARQAV